MDGREQEQTPQSSVAHWRTELADFETRKHKQRPLQDWLGRRRNKVAAMLVVLVIILVPILALSVHVVDMLNATATVNSFCSAESSGNFETVYSLLSQRARHDLTSDQAHEAFVRAGISFCATGVAPGTAKTFPDFANYPNVDTLGGTAQVKVKYVLNEGSTVYSTVSLVRDGFLGWRVDKVYAVF